MLQYKLPFSLNFQEEVQFTDIVGDNVFIAQWKILKKLGTITINPSFLVIFVVGVVPLIF